MAEPVLNAGETDASVAGGGKESESIHHDATTIASIIEGLAVSDDASTRIALPAEVNTTEVAVKSRLGFKRAAVGDAGFEVFGTGKVILTRGSPLTEEETTPSPWTATPMRSRRCRPTPPRWWRSSSWVREDGY